MLTLVQATSDQGTTLGLTLMDNSNGYTVQDITGLDPVKASVVTSSYADIDGAQFQSARRDSRNIVFTIGLQTGYGPQFVQQLRDTLYRTFRLKRSVSLLFTYDDGTQRQTSGYVESVECPLFTAKPVATVSVICGDPDFDDPNPGEYTAPTTNDVTETLLSYPGTSETGFVFTCTVDDTPSGINLQIRDDSNNIQQLNFAADMQPGDVVQISTVPGSKGATITRDNVTTSYLYGVDPNSTWLTLEPGDNYLSVVKDGDAANFTLDYTAKYEGL